jgi:hypothetical protein
VVQRFFARVVHQPRRFCRIIQTSATWIIVNASKTSPFALFAAAVMALSLPAAHAHADATSARDGQRDFDFNLGTWKIHVERLIHPLTGSKTWVALEGTKVVQKIWNGRAQLEQVEADGPNAHIENMGLMLYNPQSHQWSVSFVNSSDGILGSALFGEFKDGRGEFFGPDTYKGRAILVRITWSDITPTTHHLEQAFSADGGKTWESNLEVAITRAPDGARPEPGSG